MLTHHVAGYGFPPVVLPADAEDNQTILRENVDPREEKINFDLSLRIIRHQEAEIHQKRFRSQLQCRPWPWLRVLRQAPMFFSCPAFMKPYLCPLSAQENSLG